METLPLNSQIVAAVDKTAEILDDAQKVGGGIIYQQVAQSLGLAVQDAVDHLQQILVLNAAVTAKLAELMLLDKPPKDSAKVITLVEAATKSSTETLTAVGLAAKTVLNDFSPLAGEN